MLDYMRFCGGLKFYGERISTGKLAS